MAQAPLLLLFDIDGTLLRGAADAHRDAMLAAVAEVHGITAAPLTNIETAGRTDLEIARAIVAAAGLAPERHDERADDLRAVACREYAARCPGDLSAFLVPGAADLLERLAGRENAVLSLVTGNLEPIARLKLARAGIGHYFATGQGGFGSDHEDRALLPAIARRRAGRDGRPHPRKQTVVIGDTPRDIACGRADGVRVIAVATGIYGPDQLRDADAVARDGHELAEVLAELV